MKIFIYGSCVSRDTFEFFESRHDLSRYVARQSMVSAGINKEMSPLIGEPFESPFQQRQSVGDIQGNVYRQLRATRGAVDAILVDIVDERGGLYKAPGFGYLTRTPERVQAGWDPRFSARIEFGTDEHFRLWQRSFARFREHLSRLNFWDRTALLAVPWAAEALDATPVPDSFGMAADAANRAYSRYYDEAEASGLKLIRPACDPTEVKADTHHRWGLAPFHYASGVYKDLARQLGSWLTQVDDGLRPSSHGAAGLG